MPENTNSISTKNLKIKIVGIGNGGINIVKDLKEELEKLKIVQRAEFILANTEPVKKTPGFKTFYFGQSKTGGFSTGSDPQLGQECAKVHEKDIRNILKGADLCLIVASLGGGTGSGASLVFAQNCQKLGILSIGVFTLPFEFEGEKKSQLAKNAVQRLSEVLNGVIIVPNERIFSLIDKKTPLSQAFSLINKEIAFRLSGLFGILEKAGVINIDFADLRTILKGKGNLVFLNRVIFGSEEGLDSFLEKVFRVNILPYGLEGAKSLLFSINILPSTPLSRVNKIAKAVFEKAGKSTKTVFGISLTKKSLEINLLAVKTHHKKRALENVSKAPSLSSSTKKRKQSKKKKKKERRKVAPSKNKNNKEEAKTRKTALEVKKQIEELEKRIMEEEDIWTIPTLWRKKKRSKK